MPLQATSGAASYDAFGGGVAAVPNYIEDVFSTWLYTGNGSTQTITNGIDLSGKGGLVWIKRRNASGNNQLIDTVRGNTSTLDSGQTSAANTGNNWLSSFNSNGFGIGVSFGNFNASGGTYTSWTFREQPKFFDVVTYTGNGVAGRTVAHNLGSTPGCIIVKDYSNAGNNWKVYHRSLGGTKFLNLSATTAAGTDIDYWNNTDPTSTVFSVGIDSSVNGSGRSYVAYLFAHNAGGFGTSGNDNVISCGSFTGLATVDLGYEPQWILYKTSGSANSGWLMVDNMRGFTSGGSDPYLEANSSAAETGGNDLLTINSTGFKNNLFASDAFIYIAIRRGPMKVPTDGTKVFTPAISTNNLPAWNTGFPVDMGIIGSIAGSDKMYNAARLLGETAQLKTNTTDAEANWLGTQRFDQMTGYGVASTWGTGYMGWMFRRAPGFMDVVCYTGTGSATTVAHNLAAVPELMIVKRRDTTGQWLVYNNSLNSGTNPELYTLALQTSGAQIGPNSVYWNSATPTSTVFSLGTNTNVNASGGTYVNYLFASCPGVSKVGSYTGNGTTQAIACGFTGGARFVLIKRTDSTGDWYVYDTARGMTVLTDPYLLLNSTAAETATLGSVITSTGGFTVDAAILAAINTNGASYIFLAIA